MKRKCALSSLAACTLISALSLNVIAAEPAVNQFTGSKMVTAGSQAASGGTISSGQSNASSNTSTEEKKKGVSEGDISEDTTSNTVIVAEWKPVTAEEKAIYALVGAEKISATTEGTNVNIANSIQGKQCYQVFKEAAGDYTLARTYSIFPKGASVNKPVYETTEPVTITLKLPKSLLSTGRTYQMIGVTKNGMATVYQDEDENPDTITITTNHFYAYALCYKD